jgi:hypothetical protein
VLTYPYKSNLVLEERVSDATLRAYCVGFDQKKFRLEPLVDVITRVIPEFSLGYYEGAQFPITDIVDVIRRASLRVYTTDKYSKRGEFGELVLHLLLRDHVGSLPLVSKIYFKDTPNETVHGFDCVHIVETDVEKQLWLGESKLYKNGPRGIADLAKDLKAHLKADYLRQEFELISPKLPVSVPNIDYWRALMNKHTKLETILDRVCIPMVCTYTSSLFSKHAACTADYVKAFMVECAKLKKFFDKRISTDVDVVLMLLPVESKSELVTALDSRLKHMQAI